MKVSTLTEYISARTTGLQTGADGSCFAMRSLLGRMPLGSICFGMFFENPQTV
jgi:hypothetical protein